MSETTPAPTPAEAKKPAKPAAAPKPVTPETPSRIVHSKCGKTTILAPALADSHQKNPKLFRSMPCHHCGGNHPISEFTFEGGGPVQA